ncbi:MULTISPECIES: tail fiber domain-containing protein [Roseobacteraceae]|uniref:tail fiber domain-containing protein n=1 Tax=Roseobacteraceae TaxID=2854170 RepID=UPI0031D5F47F
MLFGQGSFINDPKATPEQVAKKRETIAAMMGQYGKASTPGEGWLHLGTGITNGISDYKLSKMEQARRAGANEQYNTVVGGPAKSVGGGLFQTAANLFSLSDERAKTDKHKIGETEDGLGLYSFQYKGEDQTQVGLMAQDVKKKKPGAVKTLPNGLMAVNYERALK